MKRKRGKRIGFSVSPLLFAVLAILAANPGVVSAFNETWTPTGNMSLARLDQTATLLTNGKVLIVGYDFNKTAELYNPVTGTFSLTDDMDYYHSQGHTATKLLDGRVLIVGGTPAQTIAEIYDPVTEKFSQTRNLNRVHSFHTATLLPDGRVLIAGGQDDAGPSTHPVAELFDPRTNAFTLTGSLNVDRSSHTATLLPNGNVLITGGFQTTKPGYGIGLNSAELYDAKSGAWTFTRPLNVVRFGHEATLLHGQVLISGGGPDTRGQAELYDPDAGIFTLTGLMTVPRSSHTATLLNNGQVLVAGGYTAVGPVTTNLAELYDLATGVFTKTNSMAVNRQQHTATLLKDGRVLVVGGYDGNAATNSAELYGDQGATPPGQDVTTQPIDQNPEVGDGTGVTVTFDSVTTGGQTTVTSSGTGTPPPSGFKVGNPPVYYEIATTAGVTPPIKVCITYTGISYSNENKLRLFHQSASGGWEDVTTSVDTVNDIICGEVSSLSPFAPLEADFHFAGFFEPIKNGVEVVNLANAGRSIPVKWQLTDGAGRFISDLAAVTGLNYQQINCTSSGSTFIMPPEDTLASGSSGLSYDAVSNQFVYTWKTAKSMVDKCYRLNVQLFDVETRTAEFEFE